MKTITILALSGVIASYATGAFSQTETTSSPTYDSTISEPESMMDQNTFSDEQDELEQQRMEERMEERQNNSSALIESADDNTTDGFDYSDRRRTNRERKAIDTSSDASDDE